MWSCTTLNENLNGITQIKFTRIKHREEYKVELNCEGRIYKGKIKVVKQK